MRGTDAAVVGLRTNPVAYPYTASHASPDPDRV